MKKIKMLVSAGLIIAACLSSNTVFAASNTLDIDSVLDTAVQSSVTIKSIDISIQKSENSYKKAVKDASDYDEQLDNLKGSDDASKLQLMQSRDDAPAIQKNALYQYTNKKEVAKNGVNLSVYQQYITLLNYKDTVDTEQKRLNNAEADYKKAQLQLDMGMASKGDVLTKQSAYLAQKAKFNSVKRQYDLQTMQLNKTVGVPIETKYDTLLKDKITDKPYIRSYNDYLNDALKNRAEILNDQDTIKLKQFEFLTIKGVYHYNTQDEYKDGQFYINEAQNTLENDKIEISIEIDSLYNDLQNKSKQLKSKKENVEFTQKDYNQALQKYNLGIISKMDLDSKAVTLQDAQNSLKTLERDIWLSQTKLNYACGIGADTSKL
ncbi:TolC family protein [Clostridium magnum]|uniref:Outer membrane efflux protein n=2 Tax=Clostridium magnum DSM 2767 TaxID=1121326 RepID=A0A162RPK8_9CLOT|nr:TolC family protein [Clostridium magnum]KZL90204.1 outer membrane efflux protein [Clostridium magnum DSM 2767]SHH64405.1 Outer membrane protein TolC [Clostridium magnum DSM 2767]